MLIFFIKKPFQQVLKMFKIGKIFWHGCRWFIQWTCHWLTLIHELIHGVGFRWIKYEYGRMAERSWSENLNKDRGIKTCLNASLPTTNPTQIGLGSKPDFSGENSATNGLGRGSALRFLILQHQKMPVTTPKQIYAVNINIRFLVLFGFFSYINFLIRVYNKFCYYLLMSSPKNCNQPWATILGINQSTFNKGKLLSEPLRADKLFSV